MRQSFFCILALALLTTVSPRPIFAKGRPIHDVYTILMVLDGCPSALLHDALAAGDLPTVQRHFVDQGTQWTDAITIFPSTTTTGYQAMVSGLFPGHAGIPYLAWLKRPGPHDHFRVPRVHEFLGPGGMQMINGDFQNYYHQQDTTVTGPDIPATLFDDLAGYPTATVYSIFQRHASTVEPQLYVAPVWAAFVRRKPALFDYYAMRELRQLYRRPIHKIPRFTLVGLVTTDVYGHTVGVTNQALRTNLRAFDRRLAQLIDALKTRGIYDKTYLIITSDHGMHNIPEGVFDLEGILTTQGLRRMRRWSTRRGQVYMGLRGVASATLTFKGPKGWEQPITYDQLRHYPVNATKRLDIVSLLAARPELELVLVRDTDRHVRVLRGSAEGRLTRHRDHGVTRYSYAPGSGDPLQLSRHATLRPYLRDVPLDAATWNRLTAGTQTPGIIPQLTQIFADGRTGDIIVIAAPGYGFYREKLATHGTHRAEDMRVPLLIRGPGIPTGQRHVAQVTDLYPTMAHWFGLPVREDLIDGRNLFK